MSKLHRIQLHRSKGWRKPANTIVVARPTKWGNPFPIGPRTPRETSIKKYAKWIRTDPRGKAVAKAAREELRGHNLACWCSLDGPCHADILLVLANS